MVRVKICGITSVEDARAAVLAGADALGFVLAPSPRRVSPEAARAIVETLPPFVAAVGVFVNETPASVRELMNLCRLDYVQFHGDETAEICNEFGRKAIRAIRVRDQRDLDGLRRYRVGAFLFDSRDEGARGGTGRTFPWRLAASADTHGLPVILSGGLTASNVADAIKAVKPYAVDVSSGVETGPGRKDPNLMCEFVRLAKQGGDHV